MRRFFDVQRRKEGAAVWALRYRTFIGQITDILAKMLLVNEKGMPFKLNG